MEFLPNSLYIIFTTYWINIWFDHIIWNFSGWYSSTLCTKTPFWHIVSQLYVVFRHWNHFTSLSLMVIFVLEYLIFLFWNILTGFSFSLNFIHFGFCMVHFLILIYFRLYFPLSFLKVDSSGWIIFHYPFQLRIFFHYHFN